MQKTIDRYMTHVKDANTQKHSREHNLQQLQSEAMSMAEKIERIESHRRKLLGESLESCSVEELHDIEIQLEKSLSNIRKRKDHLMLEQIADLKEKEKFLKQEKTLLLQKCKEAALLQLSSSPLQVNHSDSTTSEDMEVETELFIGRPGTRKCFLVPPTEGNRS